MPISKLRSEAADAMCLIPRRKKHALPIRLLKTLVEQRLQLHGVWGDFSIESIPRLSEVTKGSPVTHITRPAQENSNGEIGGRDNDIMNALQCMADSVF